MLIGLGILAGVGAFFMSWKRWAAAVSTSFLSALAAAVSVVVIGGAISDSELSAGFWWLMGAAVVGGALAWWAFGAIESVDRAKRAIFAVVGLILASIVVGSSGAVEGDLLGSFTDQVWTNFFAIGLISMAVTFLGLSRPGETRAVAVFIGLAVILNSAFMFQGGTRDRLMAMLFSAGAAILASTVLFVGANKWFDLARARWPVFGMVTGGVVGAVLSVLAWANRLVKWQIGSGEAATDATIWLIPLAVVLGAVYGGAIASNQNPRTRLFIGVGGGAVLGLIAAAFVSVDFYPAIRAVPPLGKWLATWQSTPCSRCCAVTTRPRTATVSLGVSSIPSKKPAHGFSFPPRRIEPVAGWERLQQSRASSTRCSSWARSAIAVATS